MKILGGYDGHSKLWYIGDYMSAEKVSGEEEVMAILVDPVLSLWHSFSFSCIAKSRTNTLLLFSSVVNDPNVPFQINFNRRILLEEWSIFSLIYFENIFFALFQLTKKKLYTY